METENSGTLACTIIAGSACTIIGHRDRAFVCIRLNARLHNVLLHYLTETSGEGDGLLGGGELGCVGVLVPRRHGAGCQGAAAEARRRGGGRAAVGAEEGRIR